MIRRAAPLLAASLLAGCSLLTIKSPEVPLTPLEQETRLLTRDYAAHYATAITRLIDEAAAADDDPAAKVTALKFKLGAVSEITRASTGLAPAPSLIDTWAFTVQVRDFLESPAAAEGFGAGQADLRRGSGELAAEADELARRLLGADYGRSKAFVATYARQHPLTSWDMARPSVLSTLAAVPHEKNPLHAAGTVAQALGDVSDRVRIYSERVPSMGLWEAELALGRSGFDADDYRAALRNVDAQLERISKLAETSPEMLHQAIGDLRQGLNDTSTRLDAAALHLVRQLGEEREKLAVEVAAERASLVTAFDDQRGKMTMDAAQIADHAVETSWRELHTLVREAFAFAIVLALVLLGLPFAAGYAVGRRRAATAARGGPAGLNP
jgi:hypothetical protein